MDEDQKSPNENVESTDFTAPPIEVAGAWSNPNTHAYISRTIPREENLFLEEYYSSTDTKIYLDGEEQTEVGYIQYSIQEQLKPIYGYSSRTWDDVAIGNRIVIGVIKIPIRNIDVRGYGENLKNPSISEFISYHGLDEKFEPEEHNEDEEAKLSNVEWISNPRSNSQNIIAVNTQKSNRQENREYLFYSEKLKELGYEPNNSVTFEEAFRMQIGNFQNDLKDSGRISSINSYRQLTDGTKRDIDNSCNNLWKDKNTIVIPKGSKLYNSYDIESAFDTLSEDEDFIIIVEYEPDIDGHQWSKVISKSSSNNSFGFYCKELCRPE